VRVERRGRHVDHSPPSSAEVKNDRSSTPTALIRLYGFDRNNFTFYFSYMYQLARMVEERGVVKGLGGETGRKETTGET